MKAIIVEDEPKSAENLQILVQDFCQEVEVMALCPTIASALDAIRKHNPALVFLDINLGQESGFDLFAHFKKAPFAVIFTTAYSEYAIKAFKFSALDYLLKPIDIEELRLAVKRVNEQKAPSFEEGLQQILKSFQGGPKSFSKLALPTLEGLMFVQVEDIIYCEASSNYTQFYLLGGRKFLASKTLKEYEEMLSDRSFFRIHHSYLINLNAIKKYTKGSGGFVELEGNITLDVSKRRKDSFLERLGLRPMD